jgi:hypothetical protein
MGKRKFTPRKLKSPKRQLPRRSESGVNPLATAAGAAVGATVGAKTAAKRVTRGIARNMLNVPQNSGYMDKNKAVAYSSGPDRWGTKKVDRLATAALNIDKKYLKGVKAYSGVDMDRSYASEQLSKYGGVSKATSRSILKGVNKTARTRAARRGAIAGGLSGAAISAIAQLVAKELRKKR